MTLSLDLQQVLFTFADWPVTVAHALIAAGAVLAMLVLWRIMAARAKARARAETLAAAEARAREAETRMAQIAQTQSEMQGRMQTMAELFGARQAELNQSISQRLDAMTGRIGATMSEQTKSTHENLSKLQERLAAIDAAQTNIQQLAGQVVELQAILSNKQTRGAFGQSRMEAIVADGLPQGGYSFQATLSNGNRPDCLIAMPNGAPSLVIDAKFPLEGWNAMRDASGDEQAQKIASQRFRRDVEVHVKAIAERYFIPGETQDTAFMFVPSESVFAGLHENFEALVTRAHRARIVIVSPSLLMLSIQVVQAILKDARMREQAHLIQGEVLRLMEDLSRLDDRVRKLSDHFGQAQKDVDLILTSADKVAKRGRRIEAMEFDAPASAVSSPPARKEVAEAEGGRLRLRVVEGE